MARPIKRLYAEPNVTKELRRRARSITIGARDKERTNIMLLRLDGGVVEAMSAEPSFDERGKPRDAISTIVEISERKKAEAG